MELEIGKLIASIGQSIAGAQQELEAQSIRGFLDYFHQPPQDNTAGALQPKTVKVLLPAADDLASFAPVQVPLAALAQHSHVRLDSVRVHMKMQLSQDTENRLMVDLAAPQVPEEKDESLKSCINGQELELVFQVSDPSEGTARVVQDITKIL